MGEFSSIKSGPSAAFDGSLFHVELVFENSKPSGLGCGFPEKSAAERGWFLEKNEWKLGLENVLCFMVQSSVWRF